MLSLIYGDAIAIDELGDLDESRIRVYEIGCRAFLGTDTYDIAHVCNEKCKRELITKDGDRWIGTDSEDAYIDLTEQVDTTGKGTGKFATIDVLGFDPGDDPYILCANCGKELLRDDERFEAEFGHPITNG